MRRYSGFFRHVERFRKLLSDLNIDIYADGADLQSLELLSSNPLIKGFTTNPTLMRKSGVSNYEKFAREAIAIVGKKPISFEVFTDDIDEMIGQARRIASWGENVNVKIPVINTKSISTNQIIKQLSSEGVVVNVTAIFTDEQIMKAIDAIDSEASAIISVFAGRIADSGRNPLQSISKAVEYARSKASVDILWASTREAYSIVQADEVGCDIITVSPEMVIKADKTFGKDMGDFSRETVEMFYNDAKASGFKIL
jgi:transaldolase